MSTLVANCPRCSALNMTFDLKGELVVGVRYQWQRIYELPCVCRHCKRFTVFQAEQAEMNPNRSLNDPSFLESYNGSANDFVKVLGYLSLKDVSSEEPPEYLPEPVQRAFVEGAKCLAIGCHNAAAAMFRMCVDIATRGLLPEGEIEDLSSKKRRDLGLRLPWLFEHKLLPNDLQELSKCIREDGNDGVHAGTLLEEDAMDLVDFTRALLERLFTEPEKLNIARIRREARREPKA
jgi:hypothetical protein